MPDETYWLLATRDGDKVKFFASPNLPRVMIERERLTLAGWTVTTGTAGQFSMEYLP